MAALSHSDSRRLYSWWWDSHNSPKNSKWLQDNLKDIDSKVKLMIKLLEEDADSFARRAEMYYKKRPELMKLVEEFYRAYRALAERYNHATGELRHAHRALAKAFPDQLPVELVEEDSPQKPLAHKNEPQTPETKIDEAFHDDVSVGNLKVKSAEEKCLLLEMANLSLQKEAEDLGKKIAAKDQQLSDKNEEFERLQSRLQDEHSRFAKAEATLQNLQDLHSRSRDDQRALSLELENVLHTVKCLEEEIRFVQEEKQSLGETNSSLMENMQKEILALREMKESLEKEVSHHTELSNSLQLEITRLKEVIEVLNTSYRSLGEQVEAVGVGSSIKSLQDENLKMREINEEGSNEREILSKKLKDIQESCEFLNGEKALLVSEKASLMSQLEVITNNMHKLLEKNAVLEHNLYTARVELEGLREKSKGLEEICRLLKDERSHLLNERSNLLLSLENVERRLESSEKRYIGLEEKYVDLEKEKEAVNCQVEELKISLFVEKQERSSSELQRDTRLAGLENKIHYLKEENGWKKKEYEEEVEKSLKAESEISILQKFIKDMEEKNCSLVIECHKHVEASKLAEKLIMELESESLEQQVEGELLLDEIERLRLRIYQVFRSLETSSDFKDNIENERDFVDHIVGAIEDMKCSISKHENEKELLVVENSVLLTLLEQLELKVNKDSADLVKKFSDLKEEKHKVDQHCNAALLECLETSTKSVILRRFGEEKVSEVKSLLRDLNIQHEINCNLEREMSALGEKLGLQKEENLFLKNDVRKLEGEIQGMKECNVEMKKEILSGKESLLETKGALFDTEMKLQRSMQINENLEKEMESLNVIRANLEAEISQLRKQMEEKTVREQALCLDLQEKSNEFELWEAEATSFYFDLQISSVNEVLFKNKVEELSGVCRLLENENVLKLSEIEQMNGKICSVENEISRLKSEQYAYNPVIAALREDMRLLEHYPLLQTKPKPSGNREQEIIEVGEDPKTSNSEIVVEDESLISLRNLQVRVKAVGKLMEETKKPVAYRRSISKSKEESAVNEIKPNRCLRRKKGGGNEISNTPKLHKIKAKANGMLIKDIPLDQVTSSSLKGKRKKGSGRADKVTDRDVLYNDLENVKRASEPPFNKSDVERLTSDAQKLEVLQTTVQDLRSKLETNKKSSRKGKSVDFETIQEQLLEAEETIVHLVDLNGELVKSIEDECSSPDGKDSPQLKEAVETRRELTEEARKGSERIGRLQLELQKIQYILLQVEEEKKNKGRNKFLKSKTIVLRDFFYNGRKNSGRRKQPPPFGCFRPSTSTNGSSP